MKIKNNITFYCNKKNKIRICHKRIASFQPPPPQHRLLPLKLLSQIPTYKKFKSVLTHPTTNPQSLTTCWPSAVRQACSLPGWSTSGLLSGCAKALHPRPAPLTLPYTFPLIRPSGLPQRDRGGHGMLPSFLAHALLNFPNLTRERRGVKKEEIEFGSRDSCTV